MSAFADTSAVVKLYLDEPGGDDVRVLSELVISRLTRVEVVAACWGAHRRGLVGTERTAAADDRVRTFAAFDHRLREAAAREGFALVPPTG